MAYPGESANIMARKTATAIKQINDYERKWKIQTNQAKFKIIPMAKRKLEPVIVDGEIIPYSTEGTILGLPITTTGLKKIYKQKKISGEITLNKLKRFRGLSPTNKLKLYTAYIKSALVYPPVPLHAATKTNLKALQTVQNKALRFIYNVKYTDRLNNESIHLGADIQPINQFLHEQAVKIWHKTDNTLTDEMREWLYTEEQPQHKWFKKSRPRAMLPLPPPLY